MSKDFQKLKTLMELEGTNVEQFVHDTMFESLVEGICMNDGCDATYQYEADQSKGYCHECRTRTVKSGLLLAGII